jgi:hypothetical protein
VPDVISIFPWGGKVRRRCFAAVLCRHGEALPPAVFVWTTTTKIELLMNEGGLLLNELG